MKTNAFLRTLALTLAVVMVLAMVPAASLQAKAASTTTTYTFDPTTLTTTVDKEEIAAGTELIEGKLETSGKVIKRMSSSNAGAVYAIDLEKRAMGSLVLKLEGSAIVTIKFSSTGGSNTSDLSVHDALGAAVANADGNTILNVTGSTSAAITTSYELAAGTYTIQSPANGTNTSRGVRIVQIDIVETITEGGAQTETNVYTFNATSDVALEEGDVDKTPIPAGTTYADGYITVFGDTVVKRLNGDGNKVTSTEIGKDGDSGYMFTVTGEAQVVINAASTGGSNTSTIALLDANDNVVENNEKISTVTGTSATSLTYKLSAGTYKVVSPASEEHSRAARVLAINIVETITESEETPEPSIGVYGKTLALEDIIKISYYFTLNNIADADIAESGLQVWNETDYTAAGDPTYTVEGLTKSGSYYNVLSEGIAAKNMGDMFYAKAYVTLTDGTTVYSDVIEYSAATYAQNQYVKTTAQAIAIKPVIIALMNYGAAAQTQLNYKADTLMNSFLTPEEQITAWDDTCLKVSAEDAAGKYALQTENSAAVITKIQKSLSLDGALNVNIYGTIGIADAQEVGVLYWSEAVYAANDALTVDNAVKLATVDNGSLKQATITDVAAKNMSNDCYVCVYVIDAEGNTHYSELVSYNAHNYAASQIAKNQNANLVALCKAIVVYGNAAESYFAD